ncbi:dynamin-related protein 4C-like [Pyrus ussuriensis x Pyrus communis]|uniref:Dynamin-related protein 4C-like n=1 Tax=Pyrus ussuriensis x Pyrus communis TaxID=2448454 RepID=A0A5N5FX22_9ROSA|nr:dynamin-related protein 4C-like [Pyrus ussuriensis x Pyrus communis]
MRKSVLLLDAIDKLRNLRIMEEGIPLPTIVVVGDQSSGKSSVLESLAGISLPRGPGICTRSSACELSLECNGKVDRTNENNISDDIVKATNSIAGGGKGISNTPLLKLTGYEHAIVSLDLCWKNGVPDLTMVDLPGITRVPVQGQPKNIYDQIKDMMMQYIKPEESIILNVLSASVDKTGERTLAVVMKVDKAPEGLLKKVTGDDVNIGRGYVCVRKRIGDETYEEAGAITQELFQSHPLLSNIDKSMVIPVLAQRLVQSQKINEKLNSSLAELNNMPKSLTSVAEDMTAFMQIIGSAEESLRKILLRGEFDSDDRHMHFTVRMVDMLNQYPDELHKCAQSDSKRNFLMEEINVLEETKRISLPNFLPHNVLSLIPLGFVEKIWSYIEDVVVSVLMRHSENYYQLQLSAKRAGQNLMSKMKERSITWMTEIFEMEKVTDYTCNPEYLSEWNRLIGQHDAFVNGVLKDKNRPAKITIEGIGEVEVEALRKNPNALSAAYDLKMRMTAHWKVVLTSLVDCMALHLKLTVANLVNKDLEMEIVTELMGPHGGGIERMLEESPAVAVKEKLNKMIKKLKDSILVVTDLQC